ncbi:metal ABC transporter permease [uncultured Rhodospira sp.]|uniref:metal ABC transporter permease n=1 Tax=uncultured Rhodospira sp. TaxID=1936189 RepID=UPI00260327D9|nr:metal ABC transporter permease [uncultured Rhodospira sp.]
MSLLDLLTDYTIQTVALGACLLGVISGLLGGFAVLRRQSLLGDALSHAALPGICLGFIIAGTRELGSILLGALSTGVLAALVMLLLTRRSRLKTDAGLGITLSVFFAVGIVLLTYIQGTGNAAQAGLDSFLFGQAASLLRSDVWVMGGVTVVAVVIVLAFWKEFKLVSFDPLFAASLGLPVVVLEVALTIMIALAVVVGLQMVGVVLMAAMIIAPATAARQWTRRLEGMVLLSIAFGVAGGLAGSLISATSRGLATGPLIILSVSAIVLVSLVLAPERGVLWAHLRHRRNQRQMRGAQVLETLYRLADHHDDPRYPAEQGMVDAYHGFATRQALTRLEGRGLVEPVRHEPETTPHWALTPAGLAEAERQAGAATREAV